MSTIGFSDIESVLSGVSILEDILAKMRRHSLEMAVNTLARRSMQCDFMEVQTAALEIAQAAERLALLCSETNKDLPASHGGSRTGGRAL